MILAIDPGTTESAYVLYDEGRLVEFGKRDNEAIRAFLLLNNSAEVLVIEMIASYGMAVGREVFETCVWIGRFQEAFGGPCEKVYRLQVKSHLCHSAKANDSNIRQAIIDRYPRDGGGKTPQIGTQKKPGPLHGVAGDVWAALGVAITYEETKRTEAVQ